jgi:hypothetical protein
MAANGEAPAKPTGTSLLDTTIDRLTEEQRPLLPLARLCLIGMLTDASATASFAKWVSPFFEKPAEVTGLLLQLESGWIMTIEGPSADLIAFLKKLHEQLLAGKMLGTTKVISCQEDVRKRYFPTWAHHKMSVIRSNYAEIEGDGALSALLAETSIGMLKLGKALSANGGAVSVLDRWESADASKDLADMPSNERLGQLLEIPEVTPLELFMDIFEDPVDVMMESERVWPPPMAQPY